MQTDADQQPVVIHHLRATRHLNPLRARRVIRRALKATSVAVRVAGTRVAFHGTIDASRFAAQQQCIGVADHAHLTHEARWAGG